MKVPANDSEPIEMPTPEEASLEVPIPEPAADETANLIPVWKPNVTAEPITPVLFEAASPAPLPAVE
jgi:hypothetical protein